MNRDRRDDWMVIAAIALIVVGAWLLVGRVFGPWLGPVREAIQFALRLAWPLALIGLGVLLYIASRRGGLGGRHPSGATLRRSRSDRLVGGVLGGFGAYLGIDPTWLRVAYALFALVSGFFPALVLYIVALIAIPEEGPSGAVPEPPVWPHSGDPTVTPSRPTSGWPHSTGHETVQTPPPPPPDAPDAPPGQSGHSQS